MLQVARTLEYIHSRGVVHADIKPQNILMTAGGVPIVADFDVSRDTSAGTAPGTTTVTQLGGFTHKYAAPEVLDDERATAASDVFSLGVVLSEVLLGARARSGDEVPQPPHTDRDLHSLLAGMLSADPGQRPSMSAVVSHAFFTRAAAAVATREQELSAQLDRIDDDRRALEASQARLAAQQQALQQQHREVAQQAQQVGADRTALDAQAAQLAAEQQRVASELAAAQQQQDELAQQQQAVSQQQQRLDEINAPPPDWHIASLQPLLAAPTPLASHTQLIDDPGQMPRLQALYDALARPAEHGIGADSHKIQFSKFVITRVQRVENPELWLQFAQARHRIQHKLRRMPAQLATADAALLPQTGDFGGSGGVKRECNEAYLFHGLPTERAAVVAHHGLDERVCSRAMFGHGIYFAESPSKSDQYGDKTSTTGCTMLVSRVVLGALHAQRDFLLRTQSSMRRAPCVEGDIDTDIQIVKPNGKVQPAKDLCEHERCHSVVADVPDRGPNKGLRFREFVVYDRAQVYPEYIVTYDRV